jgi:hypothetical protein
MGSLGQPKMEVTTTLSTSHDIFEVFAIEQRKRDTKMAKLPELVTPPARALTQKASEPVSTTTKHVGSKSPQPAIPLPSQRRRSAAYGPTKGVAHGW